MGHEIASGASYCAQGHPIALDAMQFANDGYGGQQQPPQQPYGGAPPQQGYAPMPPTGGMASYDAGPQAYPQPQQQQYGAPSPQAQYAAAPVAANPAFGGTPQTVQPPNLYGAPQPAFGGGGQPYESQPQQQQVPQAFGAPPPAPAAGERGTPMVLPPTALRGFLVTYQANTKGDYWPLYGGRLTVGRASSGDQVDIPLADATISSRHASMVIDGVQGAVQVEDTGSTNGTFVNEEHLGFNGRRELRDGDRIRFGGFTTIVKLIGRI